MEAEDAKGGSKEKELAYKDIDEAKLTKERMLWFGDKHIASTGNKKEVSVSCLVPYRISMLTTLSPSAQESTERRKSLRSLVGSKIKVEKVGAGEACLLLFRRPY